MAVLILFVDALPFCELPQMPHLRAWPWQKEVRPGFGYSINLHAELFAGLTPDEVGFFGEWTFDPRQAPGRRYARLLPILDRLCRPYGLNRGLQTLLTRGYRPGVRMPNLPLARLADFAHVGHKVTAAAFPHPTIFRRHPDLQVLDSTGLPKGARDEVLAQRASQAIEVGVAKLFVPLPDLDGIGHRYGTRSQEWRRQLARLDGWIHDLSERFLTRHPHGEVFVLSDHGMADVGGGIPFAPERMLGPPHRQRYLYFTDSTLVRLWISDRRLAGDLTEMLRRIEPLHQLTAAERAEYGLRNLAFGDLIGVLEEGLCFEPSTFARHIPRAMHGYHPDAVSQHAVLLHCGRQPPTIAAQRTTDVFAILDKALARG